MQMRTGVGWQYAIADLALVLFLIAASGLSQPKPVATQVPKPQVQLQPPLVADPVAVWRPGADMPTLGEWLASQPHDNRQRLTIIARYVGNDPRAASGRAAGLLTSAGPSVGPVRIVIEPAASDDLSAALTWDAGI